MAAYTPPPSPGGLRSPRKQALAMGTDPAGFQGGLEYDAQAGVPVLPGMPLGTYQSLPPQISSVGGAINTPTPFTNLKK